ITTASPCPHHAPLTAYMRRGDYVSQCPSFRLDRNRFGYRTERRPGDHAPPLLQDRVRLRIVRMLRTQPLNRDNVQLRSRIAKNPRLDPGRDRIRELLPLHDPSPYLPGASIAPDTYFAPHRNDAHPGDCRFRCRAQMGNAYAMSPSDLP